MRRVELEELRSIQLEILEDVHSFCKSEGILYSLCGGTMLGAVRHKGYIPWDDDIDLMMPRGDYERFIRSYKSDRNEILDLRKHPYSIELCLKVVRKHTFMTDLVLSRTLWGINIDIFPVDGVDSDFNRHCIDIHKKRAILPRICPFYKVAGAGKFKWFVKYLLKRIRYPYFGNVLKLKREIDLKASSFSLEESLQGGVILGSYGVKEVVPSSVFKQYAPIRFEGSEFMAICDYDTYLSSIYGDYMQLPPVEKRVTHHLYDSFIED